MFFEIKSASPEHCSNILQSSATKFFANQPIQAYQEAMQVVKNQGFAWNQLHEMDWLYLSALVFNCGYVSRQAAIHRLAIKHLENPKLALALNAWDLSYRGKYFECKGKLEQLLTVADEADKPLLIAMQSYNYSSMGWDQTAQRYHEQALKVAGNDPMVWYVLSRASARRTHWQVAIDEGSRACQLAPHWTRARAALSDSLMAVGKYEQAQTIIAPTAHDMKTCGPDYSRTFYAEISGDTQKAIADIRDFLTDWPIKNDFTKYGATKLTLLLMQNRELQMAKQVISTYELEAFEELLKVADTKNDSVGSKYISMPLVSQTRNHCVPTVAAMVAGAQGYPALPAEFAKGMGTKHGTQLWQMVDYMKSIGFTAVCVRPEIEIVTALLDQDVPLVGQLKGLFMGHVDCICGYDGHLDLIHLRDPMHWQGSCLKYEGLRERYEGTSSLWAFVSADGAQKTTIKPEWINNEGAALIDLARATSTGDRIAAETAFGKIAIGHPARSLANQHAHLVAMTESQYQESLKKLVDEFNKELEKEEGNFSHSCVEAMLQFLNEDNADDIIRMVKKNSDKFSNFFVKYVEAQCLFAKSEWQKALHAFENLCHKSPSMDNMWTQLSQVQQQLGMRVEADRSLEIAMEVAPESESLHRRKLGSQSSEIGFAIRLQHARQIIEEYPFSPSTRLTLASVMQDSNDGLGYEECLLNCIKFFPRYTYPYNTLANWYLNQNRTDVAKKVLVAGRSLIGEEEMPLWGFELAKIEAAGESQSENTNKQDDEPLDSTADENDYRTRFQKLWEKVAGDFEKSKQEMEFSDEFKELVQMDLERKIHWWESARFLSLRYANLVTDQSPRYTRQPGQRAVDLKELLPTSLPGIAESYVKAFLDSIEMPSTPHECLVVLLEWVDASTPMREQFPDLQFLRAYLLEQLEQLNEAELVLHQIVENFPAEQSALYRLAQIAEQQADLKAAQEFYLKCLEVSPGHFGSNESVVRLAHRIGQPTIELQQQLLNTFPYSPTYIYNVAVDLATNESTTTGDQFYLDNESRMPADRFHVLRARMLYDTGRKSEAIQYLDQHEDSLNGKPDYTAEWLRVEALVEQCDYSAAVARLEKMDEDWPYDQELIDQLIRIKRELNLADAKRYAKKQLSEGCPVFVVAYVYLQGEKDAADLAIDMLNQVPIEARDAVAHQMVEAIQQTDAAPAERIKLMQFCRERLSHLHGVRRALAYDLSNIQKKQEAVDVAKELLAEQPGNPHWLELVGHCYEGFDNDQCLHFLQLAYEVTGRAETLVHIGRNQSMTDEKESEKTFWEVLKLDPFNTVAMTNLYWVNNVCSPPLWTFIEPALKAQGAACVQSEYFLTTARIVAEKLQKQMPEVWFAAAVQRAKDVAQDGGFADEPEQLGAALTQWWNCWMCDQNALNDGRQSNRAANELWIPPLPQSFIVEDVTGLDQEHMDSLFDYLTKMQGDSPPKPDNKFPERIAMEMQEAENSMKLGEWGDARIQIRRAVDKFDESVDRDNQLAVVQRLIDAENGGCLLDKLARIAPGNCGFAEGGLIAMVSMLVIATVSVWPVGQMFQLSVELSTLAVTFPFLAVIGLYAVVRDIKASRKLKELLRIKSMSTHASFGPEDFTAPLQMDQAASTDTAAIANENGETVDEEEKVGV